VQHRQARANDFWSGLFWIVLGVAIAGHSATMPVPTHLGATTLTGPGLVPGLLGAGLALLGLILSIRAVRGTAIAGAEDAEDPSTVSFSRAMLALVLMVAYAAALALRQPFVPSTVLFITVFATAFNWAGRGWRPKARVVAGALVLALVTGFTVEFLFETVFFVRLP